MIQTQAQLLEFLSKIEGETQLAIDTEFKRVSTFYPQLCLVQIASNTQIDCVDVLALTDLSPLFEKLYHPEVEWIVHAARQDLEALYYLSGQLPKQLFDTQIAAALLGQMPQISYQALTEMLQGVHLDKAYTRLDWTTRPLPEGAVQYALDDVKYLLENYRQLQQQLMAQDRRDWLSEEAGKLLNEGLYQPDLPAAWQKVKGIRHIAKRAHSLGCQLSAWREQQASEQDKPRKWVMSDEALLSYALGKQTLSSKAQTSFQAFLETHPELSQLQAINLKERIPNATEKAEKIKLQKLIQQKADTYNLDSSMIANGKSLLRYIRGDDSVEFNQGWRGELLRGELNNAK